jgi:hypothetical protein
MKLYTLPKSRLNLGFLACLGRVPFTLAIYAVPGVEVWGTAGSLLTFQRIEAWKSLRLLRSLIPKVSG